MALEIAQRVLHNMASTNVKKKVLKAVENVLKKVTYDSNGGTASTIILI